MVHKVSFATVRILHLLYKFRKLIVYFLNIYINVHVEF